MTSSAPTRCNDGKLRAYDLGFFGAIAGSIAHELNNVLATINELRGLLDDFIMASKAGQPVDASRFKSPVQRMAAQIERGRDHAAKLSRFAHSVDRTRDRLDVGEAMRLSAALCERLAALKRVDVVADQPDVAIHVDGCAFDLLHILYRAVDAVLAHGPRAGPMRLSCSEDAERVRVTLTASCPSVPGGLSAEAALDALSLVSGRTGGAVTLSSSSNGMLRLVVSLRPTLADPEAGEGTP